MDKQLSDVPKDIYSVLEDDKDYRTDATPDMVSEIHDAYNDAVSGQRRPRKDNVLYASEVGKPCTRQVWYSHHEPEKAEPIKGAALFKFLYGHVIEALALQLAEDAGHCVQGKQETFEVEIPGTDWRVRGRCDAIIDGAMVDVKSASKFAYAKYKKEGLNASTDSFGYRAQLQFYQKAAWDRGMLMSEKSYLLLVSKELGNITLVEQDASYTSEQWLREAEEKVEAIIQDEPPQRGFDPVPEGKSGNMKLGVNCSYCPFKTDCWPEARTFLYSNRPVTLVHVEREPKVPELGV